MEITVSIPRLQARQEDKSSQGHHKASAKEKWSEERGCRKLGIKCTKGGYGVAGSLEWQRGKPSQQSMRTGSREEKKKKKYLQESGSTFSVCQTNFAIKSLSALLAVLFPIKQF